MMKKDPGSKNKLIWRLAILGVVLFFSSAAYYFLIAPIQQSKHWEQALIDQFGWANSYTPPATGHIPPERMEHFIRVRTAIQPNCAIFQNILDNVIRLETLDSDQEMSGPEQASEIMGTLKSMFSAAPTFLEFMDARNQSLLAEDMGIGEYLYIYLAAYGPQLAAESESRYAEQEDAYISQRTRDEYIQILQNQQEALNQAKPTPAHRELTSALQAETDRLRDSSDYSPWPGGPPDAMRESLAPYQAQIDDLYCEGTVRVELLQKNRGLSFE